jgi:hypothetical protein
MDRTAQGLKDLPKVICVGILSYGRHTRRGQRPKYFTARLQSDYGYVTVGRETLD